MAENKKLLICVTNNLKYDSRVKRHALFLSDLFAQTEVLCLPMDDDTAYLEQKQGLRQIFAKMPPAPDEGLGVDILAIAEDLGVLAPLLSAFPFIGLGKNPPPWFINSCLAAQSQMAEASGYTLLHEAQTGEMPIAKELESIHRTLGLWLYMAQQAVQIPADVVLCNDIDTLFCGVAHKLKYGSRLIYDAHEVYFDIEPTRPLVYKQTMAFLERELIQYPDCMMGIGQALVDWERHTFAPPCPAYSIPNCISYMPKQPLKPKALNPDNIRLYYHGASDEHRGIEFIMQALAQLDSRFSLVLKCTPSDNIPALRAYAKQLGIENRVVWKPPVPAQEIVQGCYDDGDIAFTLPNIPETGSVVNKVSLTNKFLEYLRAGVPIISSIHVEHNNIITRYGAGAVAKNNGTEAVLAAINKIIESPEGYTKMSAAAMQAADELFSWERCSQTLKEIFTA